MTNERIIFTGTSPHGDYKPGEYGVLVGFCRGGDDIPYAIARKDNGHYVMSQLTSIVYAGE